MRVRVSAVQGQQWEWVCCGDGFATKDEALAFLKRVLPSLSEAQRAAAEEEARNCYWQARAAMATSSGAVAALPAVNTSHATSTGALGTGQGSSSAQMQATLLQPGASAPQVSGPAGFQGLSMAGGVAASGPMGIGLGGLTGGPYPQAGAVSSQLGLMPPAVLPSLPASMPLVHASAPLTASQGPAGYPVVPGGYGNNPAASMPQVQLQQQVQVGSGAMLQQPANPQQQPIIIIIQQQQPQLSQPQPQQQQQPPHATMFPGHPWSGGPSFTSGPPAVPGSAAAMPPPLAASGPSPWGGSGMMPQVQHHSYGAWPMSAGQQQQQQPMHGSGQQLQQPTQNVSQYQQQQQPMQAQGQQQQLQHQTYWRG